MADEADPTTPEDKSRKSTRASTVLDSATDFANAVKDGANTVAKWGPQQVIQVAFLGVLAAMVAIQFYDKSADRETRLQEQSRLILYFESEAERSRIAATAEAERNRIGSAAEAEKQRQYFAQETEKLRTFFAASERDLLGQLEKLRTTIDRLRVKLGPDEHP